METWAYLQAESAYENDDRFTPVTRLNFFRDLDLKKLSSLAWFYLLKVALIFATLSLALPALAALSRGNRGTEVRALQVELKTAGFFNGPITGFYGSLTETAVKKFQESRNLKVDGIAGSKTLSVLRQRSPSLSRQNSSSLYSASTADLQRLLIERGFDPGSIDGIYGSSTRAAVKAAQKRYGLIIDGIAGSKTLAALRQEVKVASSTTSGQSITELQQLLANQGFYAGAIDGIYGPNTRTAVRAAQQAYGLVVDGVAGPMTFAALRRYSNRQAQQYSEGTVELQRLLTKQGFYTDAIDGIYGPSTATSVRAAQQAYGLTVDGVAGPDTLSVLRRSKTIRQSRFNDRDVLPVPIPPPGRNRLNSN